MSLNIHENIYKKLDYFYESNKIPHIIFHGSSGSGKRTIVDNFLNKIYKNDNKKLKTNVMLVNCAHGKGIKFIREELKFFAKTNIQANSGVLFKTIVLINADNLTIDAQSALRRCIELFSANTRFFIIVENKQKLLNPILSRFCEIYVPEYIVDGKVINLHQYNIQKHFRFEDVENDTNQWITENISRIMLPGGHEQDKPLDIPQDKPQDIHKDMVELATEFYEKGISCLDLIKWIENTNRMSELKKCDVLMYFDKIKSEYRCEKLLLLCIFDYICSR